MGEENKKMSSEQTAFATDEDGFWHFVVHPSRGIDATLGFLLRMQDVVKAHYIQEARQKQEEAQIKSVLRPENVEGVVKGVKKPKWH